MLLLEADYLLPYNRRMTGSHFALNRPNRTVHNPLNPMT